MVIGAIEIDGAHHPVRAASRSHGNAPALGRAHLAAANRLLHVAGALRAAQPPDLSTALLGRRPHCRAAPQGF